MKNKLLVKSAVLGAIALSFPMLASSATYTWLTPDHNGGTYGNGATSQFNWTWNTGDGVTRTGTLAQSRSGTTYGRGAPIYELEYENHASTITNAGYSAPPYYSSYANSLGGVNNSYHFASRLIGGSSQIEYYSSTWDFTFTQGESPIDTVISLFDPGSAWHTSNSNSYTFQAFYNGTGVDTSLWSLVLDNVYSDAYPSTYHWNGSTLTVNNFNGGNFPERIAYLDTNGILFDRLVINSWGTDSDTFGIGLAGAPNPAPVPLPPAWILLASGLLFMRKRNKISNGSPSAA